MSHITLHIDELVLYGFAPRDRDRIGQAMAQELTRLVTEQGLPPALLLPGQLGPMDGGAFQVTAGMTAEGIGVQVAQAVYGGLRQ